ncbi:hypothetical protein [Nostoc sp.]|uniref:hypothetical protein n=1 Tax=Nostoc sp. TaxID=1180 RepID=UPI002FF5E8B1
MGIGDWAWDMGHGTFTGSQPGGWEPILGGSASSGLTRGSSPLRIRSQPGGWERGAVPSTQYPVPNPVTLGTDAQ